MILRELMEKGASEASTADFEDRLSAGNHGEDGKKNEGNSLVHWVLIACRNWSIGDCKYFPVARLGMGDDLPENDGGITLHFGQFTSDFQAFLKLAELTV